MQHFEPDQLVLVRENDTQVWRLTHYSHSQGTDRNITIDGKIWASKFIIPYQTNEYLLGTDEPKWEPKSGELVAVKNRFTGWKAQVFSSKENNAFVCKADNGQLLYWDICEPLRKHFNVPEE